jgi:hypothetical protein
MGVRPEDVAFDDANFTAVISLGKTVSIKSDRQQCATVYRDESPQVLKTLVDMTPEGTPVFPFTTDRYRRRLEKVEVLYGLLLGMRPHSPRAGFATDRKRAGVVDSKTRGDGRWVSESSYKIYLDVVAALSAEIDAQARAYGPLIE